MGFNYATFIADRFYFVMGEGWYFEAHGLQQGPYLTRRDAEHALRNQQ